MLYRIGLFDLILQDEGSDFSIQSKILFNLHKKQHFEGMSTNESILKFYFPSHMIEYLQDRGPDAFASLFVGDHAEWNQRERYQLINSVTSRVDSWLSLLETTQEITGSSFASSKWPGMPSLTPSGETCEKQLNSDSNPQVDVKQSTESTEHDLEEADEGKT